MYRYSARLPGRSTGDGVDVTEIDEALRHIGLQPRLTLGRIELYASDDTPVVSLSPDDALIGHAFSRNSFTPIDGAALSSASTRSELANRIINECWGEYVHLHTPTDDSNAKTVMRDPSGGVDCVYSLRDGFITSDISVATHARLYTKEIDWDFIRSNLIYPYLKTGFTGFVGLRELLPGCQLSLCGPDATIKQLWTPWDFFAPQRRPPDRTQAHTTVHH